MVGDSINRPFSIVVNVRLIMAHTPCSVSALAVIEASGGGVIHECGLRHRPYLRVPLSIGAQGGDHHWDHIHVVGSCTDDGSCVLLRP